MLVKLVDVTETRTPAQAEITAPTAGTLTKAATWSFHVSIFRPAVRVAVTAGFAARVRPVHVTVTAPAARVDVGARVIVITSVAYIAVPAAVAGDEMAQPVPAVTCPAGKVSVSLLSVA